MSEFNIGDTVTFKPYDDAIKAEVRKITRDPDGSVYYHLRADSKRNPNRIGLTKSLVTTTTGRSIKESKLYKQVK